jgi:hypothetical protein
MGKEAKGWRRQLEVCHFVDVNNNNNNKCKFSLLHGYDCWSMFWRNVCQIYVRRSNVLIGFSWFSTQTQSQSYFTTGCLPPISSSWRKAPSDSRPVILFSNWTLAWSRDSVVGIATGYGLDDREVEVRVPVGSRIFSSPCRPDRLWGSPNLLSNGYRRLFPPGVKRPGREVDNWSPACTEVKKMWICTPTPPYAFME